MKSLNTIIIALVMCTLSIGCEKDDSINTTCDSENGVEIKDQVGRIYKWTNSQPNFFYIGNTTQVSNGVNGGYIPCNGLLSEFQYEGIIVQYSGIDKGSYPDTNDPLFDFITLSKIERIE